MQRVLENDVLIADFRLADGNNNENQEIVSVADGAVKVFDAEGANPINSIISICQIVSLEDVTPPPPPNGE